MRRAPEFLAFASLLFMLDARAEPSGESPAIPVVDLHVDLSYQHVYQNQRFDQGTGQYRASDLVSAGVRGVVLPLFVPHRVSPNGPRVEDLENSYARVFDELARTRPYLLPGCHPEEGKVQTFFAFEGAAPLADDPEAPLRWVARGVRFFGLVHTRNNRLASSSTDPNPSYGLTEEGRRFVERVHRAGGLVDISHASDRAAREVLALARKDGVPVVATHSNARALADHPRNLSDELLRAVAASGGVVGVNFHSPFVVRGRPAKLADVVAQVRYLVRVMGVEHVALGSDFEGDIRPPPGLEDARGFGRLASALEKSGFSRAEVEAVFATNAERLLCRVPPASP
jgi:membrane dipeptidase